ncbi:MAG: class I SAM-dependent methyltransferase [Weeksellaceae bacterium]|nr:class I SAM-dependent methyltransferase [Weeksellaceae bacterium]
MNFKKKYYKLNHIFLSILNERKTLDFLNQTDETAKIIGEIYYKLKNKIYTKEEINTFALLENHRVELLKSDQIIDYSSFNLNNRKVDEICKSASSKKVWCEFYNLLTKKTNSKNVLEIGTNLGISGQYFLEGITCNYLDSFFLTFEGLPDLCKISEKRFLEISNRKNFSIIQGFFDNTLKLTDTFNRKFDIIFIDGNHKYKPTLDYFNFLKNYQSNNSIFIFDDIYWNEEMIKAWKEIKKLNNGITIDFFSVGFYLPNTKKNKDLKLFLAL